MGAVGFGGQHFLNFFMTAALVHCEWCGPTSQDDIIDDESILTDKIILI